MAAISRHVEVAYRGVDLTLGLNYTPPVGDDRAGLAVTAVLYGNGNAQKPASSLTFDPATGAIVANWDETATLSLVSGATYDARFIRNLGGQTRVFYIRKVTVQ